ncbi:MAG: CoB--CoM heterodisulfide reductase iron-sulfur subunit A family protein [Methanocellales archaeon]|nr:CoB--CoM heterodisulfide reductase iron-sulfur subunit A family protein [Methanocellales archaeon]MDD3291465.1 CoB--CoM heterodisulfide reductase iron-sulfur subunit A family protein [Methanocellales archaeon]MDD5234645.1 CoB--CoM heterodisulfide reductase iron-sulfur subunit A family protein [Methanocellales archaeon]MDD5485002.1 CoB--CoM heterodisulfide reductase iron-sulfur subunit A family protein [Methanocellales archaeon]
MREKEIRIGVFVCHCGTNIGGSVDVPAVVEYAKHLPNVVHAERNLYTCADDGLTAIKNAIKEHKLNRVIVASCTPRTHEPLFRSTCEEAGLNKYLFEFVNIREHCSWVHMKDPEGATEKTKELVRMGVARATLLEPQEEMRIDVEPSAMVIGGGIAGMTAAKTLANQGFDVYLVEKEAVLGGMLRNLYRLFPTGEDSLESLQPSIAAVEEHKKIKIFSSCELKEVKGYIGNFDVTLLREGEEVSFKVGTIIVATGAMEFEPKGYYGYGTYDHVITQMQLEKLLKEGQLKKSDSVVMIQCVGAKGEGVSYCSRICCMVAIKNAMLIKEINPDVNIQILHNDIQAYGAEYEELYSKAREMGVRFIKYTPESPPSVTMEGDKLKVEVYNELFGEQLMLGADLVVLSTPLVQHQGGVGVSKLLRVPLGKDKFFFEAHVKLRPVDFATDGIFLCGTAHGPAEVAESVSQALAAASGAGIPLSRGFVQIEAISVKVDPEACVGCGFCVEMCPYQALSMVNGKLEVIEALCKGCGTCVATCPTGALEQRHYQSNQIISQIKSIFHPVVE